MKELFDYINKISPLSAETFTALQTTFQPLELAKGDFFIQSGVCAQQIGFLKSGVVRAFFLNQDGKEYTKQFFVGPCLVGAYSSLLTKQPTKIAQQALTDCVLLVANYKQLEKNYDNYHDLERLGRKIAEKYFLEKEQKEIEMGLLDADKRYIIMKEKFPAIESIVPQYYVASYLGITPTQLSRIRKKLKII